MLDQAIIFILFFIFLLLLFLCIHPTIGGRMYNQVFLFANLKQNEAQSARAESTLKGVN